MSSKNTKLITILLSLCLLFTNLSYAQEEADAEQPEAYENCDLFIENGLCLYNGDTVISPPPIIDHLLLFLTFDQRQNLDNSGRGNHASGSTNRGPGHFISQGYSAHLQGEQSIKVTPSDDMNAAFQNEYSMSFWLFANAFNTLTTEQCSIIEKGTQDESDFSFTIEMSTRQILVTTQTTLGPLTLTSNARILHQRWTHVALFRTRRMLVLYVNGNLDAVLEIQEGGEIRNSPIHIGRMPWQDYIGSGCTLDLFFDEFKFWDSPLEESYIEAESGIALGSGIDPHSIELGCLECSIERALESCTEQYHLCTTVEMYSFAFAAAKSMGWSRSGQRIWSDRAAEAESSDLGLAICCRNY